MIKIGLTGGVASGKSTVCRLFSQRGVTILDADDIARELVEIDQPCYLNIVNAFGPAFLLKNRQLDRAKLRHFIFSDLAAKQQLEMILHPPIRQQLIERSQVVQSPYCILAIPLLIEANMTDCVDHILVIDTTKQNQLDRLCKRDHISLALANNMISQQSSHQQRLALADDVIANDSTIQHLEKVVSQHHEKYLNLANSSSNGCQSVDCHGE
jgi:dephospho-CoA kinase